MPPMAWSTLTCAVTILPICTLRVPRSFPTFGFANPTLTIVALTLRLAEHLQERLGLADA